MINPGEIIQNTLFLVIPALLSNILVYWTVTFPCCSDVLIHHTKTNISGNGFTVGVPGRQVLILSLVVVWEAVYY